MLFGIVLLSIFGSLEANVIGGLVVLVVAAAVTSLNSRRRKDRDTKKEDEKTVTRQLATLTTLAENMHAVLVGAPKTDLNPNPSPGLVVMVPELVKKTQRIERTLFENGGKGNTVLDRLDRVEKKLDTGSAGIERIETQQTVLRDAAEALND